MPISQAAGFTRIYSRILPDGLRAVIERKSIPDLPIFRLIRQMGGLQEEEMFGVFNMGVGLCIAVSSDMADRAVRILNESGENAVIIGRVEAGEKGVEIC